LVYAGDEEEAVREATRDGAIAAAHLPAARDGSPKS